MQSKWNAWLPGATHDRSIVAPDFRRSTCHHLSSPLQNYAEFVLLFVHFFNFCHCAAVICRHLQARYIGAFGTQVLHPNKSHRSRIARIAQISPTAWVPTPDSPDSRWSSCSTPRQTQNPLQHLVRHLWGGAPWCPMVPHGATGRKQNITKRSFMDPYGYESKLCMERSALFRTYGTKGFRKWSCSGPLECDEI